MWSAVQLAKDHSSWRKLASADDVAALQSNNLAEASAGDVYYFWDAEFPAAPEEMQKLYDEMVAANGGVEIRVIVGASLSHLDSKNPESACSGQCFCVVQGNSRRCEVCYQGGGGPVCVPCGSSC